MTPSFKIVALAAVFVVGITAALSGWMLLEHNKTKERTVFNLQCPVAPDGKVGVVSRSYNRGAMEALGRKLLVEGKLAPGARCVVVETVGAVPMRRSEG